MRNKISFLLLISGIAMIIASCSNDYKYQLSVNETFDTIKNIKPLPLNELVKIISTADTNNYQFVDIRTPHEYVNGHILNAINVPFKSLDEKNCKTFCDNKKVYLLYGKDASEALLANSYLLQLGIKNTYSVGSYDFIKKNILDEFAIHSANYNDEDAKYDYARIIAEISGGSNTNTETTTAPPPVVPVQRNNSEGNVGGCE
jgi:rhodanese-related sulfurtransferase